MRVKRYIISVTNAAYRLTVVADIGANISYSSVILDGEIRTQMAVFVRLDEIVITDWLKNTVDRVSPVSSVNGQRDHPWDVVGVCPFKPFPGPLFM